MEDLFQSTQVVLPVTNRHLTTAEKTLPQKNVFSNISPTSSFGGKTSHLPAISGVEQENEQLWRKLSTLREDNARLVSQNNSLVREMENLQMELTESKVKFCHLEPSTNDKAHHISKLCEDILSLEAEVEAQKQALSATGKKLKESQWMVVEKDKLIEKLSEECRRLKNELHEQNRRGKRTEQQRNEALVNAEELSAAFRWYKEKTAEHFTKFQANEEDWQSSLYHSNKDRAELFEKSTTLEKELGKKNEEIRLLTEQNSDLKMGQKDLESKNAGLFSILSNANERVKMLENELVNKETVLKDQEGLSRENEDLRLPTTSQNEKVLQLSKELESTKLEMRNLESLLQLHRKGNKEGESAVFSARIINENYTDICPSTKSENEMKGSTFTAHFSDSHFKDPRLKLGMKDGDIQKLEFNSQISKQQRSDALDKSCNSLGRISPALTSSRKKNTERKTFGQDLEEVRYKQRDVEELQTKLLEAESVISTLETQMTEQINSCQNLEEHLLGKDNVIERLEQELRKNKSQLFTMEKQLEEKTIAYSTNAAKVVECEQEIEEKNKEIINLETLLEEQQQKNIAACELTKKIQTEQCEELEKQIEILENDLKVKQMQMIKQKQTISTFQEDIYAKESRIELLEFQLEETRQESKKQNEKNEAALKALQTQAGQETSKVKELEAALVECKEERKMQLQQIDESREQQEKQLRKKLEEVHWLQKDVKISAHNLKEANEQNVQLQQTLLQYQQMLQQGTARIGDLEDHQAVLEREVSKLEQELLKQKMLFTDKLSKAEDKLFTAYAEQDSKHQQVSELISTMKELKMEMEKCKDEVTVLEKELFHLRQETANKDVYRNQLEFTLQNSKAELNTKSEQVHDLEKNLCQTETQWRNSVQKVEEMDNQLKNAYQELQDTLDQLKLLRDVLQKTQNSIEEKNYTIEELTKQLGQYKSELQERDSKIIDMDQALKDRQRELQQRAAQLTQLDIDVCEHKTEIEQKITYLQDSLENSELTIKERNAQVDTLDEKLQRIQKQLCEKEFELLQREQQINQLKSEAEGKDLQIEEYEQILKRKEQCILKQQQEVLDESQQVHIAREQMQQCYLELRETQQRLVQVQREADRLTLELDETTRLSQEKITMLKERGPQFLASTEENSTTHVSNEQVIQLKQELKRSQETVLRLELELRTQRKEISAAKEALIIKESEVARLQVKISGFERAKGRQQLPSLVLQPQKDSENRQNCTMQAQNFYPLVQNMNGLLNVNDVYATDLGSALNSLNFSNRIQEIVEQSFLSRNINLQNTEDASCPNQREDAALFSSSPKPEAELDLEFAHLTSNCETNILSGMFNHLISREGNNTNLGSSVDSSSELSSEQIKSRVDEYSAGRHRIPSMLK
ncbi:coiled-coil domain-containing protein 18 isoform X2 [Narcine bancroftii]|uniref:coiled-coil domain-containing protein 18 isoform X2 n=1 Tax=Narcine bancroftii TaxID=1343680 RepID=UPI00383109BA